METLRQTKTSTFLPAACFVACSLLTTGCENPQATVTGSEATEAPPPDSGKKPWVLNIEEATVNNADYRNTKWTGEHLQMVLMSLKPGEEIDLEIHRSVDQFIRIEQGEARVRMGKSKDELTFDQRVSDDWAVLIPAGYYHNVRNTGNTELKLYTIYAPPEHPAGTVHKTYREAQQAHEQHEED